MANISIVKLIPYFGKWPDWFELFLLSCEFNPTVNWIFYTDCPIPDKTLPNVKFIQTSFENYKRMVSDKLDIKFNPISAYKLCDLKPALGYIHHEDIADYDFYAFGDIDVIYGQIRQFITDEMLNKYDVIGTHDRRLSGHFCFFRNNERNRNAFRKIKHWQKLLETEQHLGIDESKFSKIFVAHKNHPKWLQKLWSIFSRHQRKVLYKEQFSTVLSPILWCDGQKKHPESWRWHNGNLSNDIDDKYFMYLHFMNWKSSRWLPKQYRSNGAAWENVSPLVRVSINTARQEGFKISTDGFTAIN